MQLPACPAAEEQQADTTSHEGSGAPTDTSQSSLDTYYDAASGTLTRRGRGDRPSSSIARSRPVSLDRHLQLSQPSTPLKENQRDASTIENGQFKGYHNGMHLKGPVARVRHASYTYHSPQHSGGADPSSMDSPLNSKYSTPYQSALFSLPPPPPSSHLGSLNGVTNGLRVHENGTNNALTNGNGAHHFDLKEASESNYFNGIAQYRTNSNALLEIVSENESQDKEDKQVSQTFKSRSPNYDTPSSKVTTNESKEGTNKKVVINYVQCVEIERDPIFKARQAQRDKTHPTPDTIPEIKEENNTPSKSKTSSCLSLNFNWKMNYVPAMCFVDQKKSLLPSETSKEPLLGQTEATASPIKEVPASVLDDCPVVTTYSFNKDGGGGGAATTTGLGWKEEFTFSSLSLTHSVPHLFVSSQWQQRNRMSCLYLGYRIFWALYFALWAVWAVVASGGYHAPWCHKVYHFIYLTNWSVWVLVLDTTLQAVNLIFHMRKLAEDGDARYAQTPHRFRLSWLLSNVSFAAHVTITCAYWSTVFPFQDESEVTFMNVNKHIVPGVYVIMDSIVSGAPRRLLHAVLPVLYFFVYTLFSLVYYIAGGTTLTGKAALYPFLDWSNVAVTIPTAIGFIFIVTPVVHALHCLLYRLRLYLYSKYQIQQYNGRDCELQKVNKYEEQIV